MQRDDATVEVETMTQRLRANILRHGNMVRSRIARAATVVRYLERVGNLAEYEVIYWQSSLPRRVTADGFLALYEAGTFDPARQRTRGEYEIHKSVRKSPI